MLKRMGRVELLMNKEDEMCVEEGKKKEGVEGRSCHEEEQLLVFRK